MLHRIDATIEVVTCDDPTVSPDAVRYNPSPSPEDIRFATLFIPADASQPVRVVDLFAVKNDFLAAAYDLIKCSMIEVIDPADGISFVFDEEGSPLCNSDAVHNDRATYLAHAVKFAQATGEYPADDSDADDPRHRLRTAFAWQRRVRLFGNVMVVGFDPESGEHHPVPEAFVAFAAEALDLDTV